MDDKNQPVSMEESFNEVLRLLRLKPDEIVLDGKLTAIHMRDKRSINGVRTDISSLLIQTDGALVEREFRAHIDDASIGNQIQIYSKRRNSYLLDTQIPRVYKA